jgi:hypothetical protein
VFRGSLTVGPPSAVWLRHRYTRSRWRRSRHARFAHFDAVLPLFELASLALMAFGLFDALRAFLKPHQ